MDINFGHIYTGAKVLVTGNTGFKGSWLSLWLHQLGAKVVGLSDSVPTTPSNHDLFGLSGFTSQHWVDVRDADAVKRVFEVEKPDFIFHLAAQSITKFGIDNPLATLSTNTLGTANVLDAIRQCAKPCTAIIITSDKCYLNKEWHWGYRETDALGGKDMYSASKASAEIVIQAFVQSYFPQDGRVRLATARSGNVVGGGDWSSHRIVPDYMKARMGGQRLQLRSPNATRPWLFVLEPLAGYLRMGQLLAEGAPIHGESFNFGPKSGDAHTVLQLLEALNGKLGKETLDELVTMGAPDSREAGLLKLVWDKAETMLGWRPLLSFDELASYTADWYANYLGGRVGMLPFSITQLHDYQNKLGGVRPWPSQVM